MKMNMKIIVVMLMLFQPKDYVFAHLVNSPKFPYGVSSFKKIIQEKQFCADKTKYICKLEKVGNYNKIWRPRRFGKTLICDMLTEYYDAANKREQV
jgi:hypothetical protein